MSENKKTYSKLLDLANDMVCDVCYAMGTIDPNCDHCKGTGYKVNKEAVREVLKRHGKN